MARHQRTRVVIADGARARFLDRRTDAPGYDTVSELVASTLHARASDLVTDRPGRVHESAVAGRHGVEPKTDPRALAKRDFAELVADAVNEAAADDAFDRLVLVAPARTLAPLQGALSATAAARVAGTLDKDLTRTPIAEIPEHIAALDLPGL